MPARLTGPATPVVPDRPQAQRYTDANRPMGARGVLRGRQVVWAGPGWRWQSPASYSRLQRERKLNRSFWSDPIGVVGNELRYIGRQIRNTDVAAQRTGRIPGIGMLPFGIMPPGSMYPPVPQRSQTVANVAAGLTIGAAENAGKLVAALGQAAQGKPSNPEGSRSGNAIERVSEVLYRAAGATPPAQQNSFERGLDATARSIGTAAVGTIAAVKAIPAIGTGVAGAAITGGLRWGLGELITTFFDDNRGGNIANLGQAAGLPIPGAIDIGKDDWLTSAAKSLVPNALPGVALSGFGEALSRFSNTRRFLRESGVISSRSQARSRLEQAGITQTDPATGTTSWREAEAQFTESIGIGDSTPPAAAAPDPAAAPAAPPRQPAAPEPVDMPAPQSVEVTATPQRAPEADSPQLTLQLDAQPPKADAPSVGGAMEVEEVDIDPADLVYDPALPEADVVLTLLRDVDDTDLVQLAQPGTPVVQRLDEILATQRALPVRPELEQGNVMAPSGNVAERIGANGQPMPYEAMLESMRMETLRSVAAPENNRDLAQLISDATGKSWEEFDRGDIIQGLAGYQQESGMSLLVRDWGQGMRRTEEIVADPARFQFKGGVNDQGEQLGNSLAGVDRWDTVAEGVIDVWTDPLDGRTYVVNGHNRLARARQLGIPTLPTRELPAATAAEARGLGALANIKEGRGTVFDAAKFMRESGITTPEQLQRMGAPMSSGNAARGLALSQLPDNIFQAAVDGRLSVGKAAALGGSGLDETQMQAAYRALSGRDMSDAKFSEIVEQVRSAPTVQGDQVDLFGNTEAMSLMEQKADLAVAIRRDLLKDKRFFSTAARGADRLEQAGNRINVQGNKEIAADADQVLRTFDQLKYATGPVSELLNDGARQIAEGAKPKVIADRIREQVAEAVRQSLEEQGLPTQRPAAAAAPDPQSPPTREELDQVQLDPETQAIFDEMEGIANSMGEWAGRNAEMARRGLEALAGIEDINGGRATDRIVPNPRLTSEQRSNLQLDAIRNAIDNGEVRPPETPLPEPPAGPAVRPDEAVADLDAQGGRAQPGTPAAQAMADEFRLGAEYRERDARLQEIAEEGFRDATGYELRSFEEKKELGLSDGYDPESGADVDMSATPQGWGQVDGLDARSQEEIDSLQRMATSIIRKVAGDDVAVRFEDTYKVGILPRQWGGDGKKTASFGGFYSFDLDLIVVRGMLERGIEDTADVVYHEAFHRIQYVSLSPKEASVLDTAFARLKIATGSGHINLDNAMPSYSESMAVAFARYATAKALGNDPIVELLGAAVRPDDKVTEAIVKVVSGFDIVLDFVEKMYNLVKNGTFDSARGIFERVRRGKLRDSDDMGGLPYMEAQEAPGWRVSTASGSELPGAGTGADLLPAPIRPEPMQLADGADPPAKPRTKKADDGARKQIDANNQRMDEIRRQAQQEGC